ncbi:hypothetical protein Ngar_c05010 [Candidatus Nitrososphaera gargensis Ga9.2]|uniref:Uncharacterized protein n=1 Tax=Nitrososphaera gargensis (strain Ga9.2) TaxID=1237085 RepID=K0ICS1_NITGG|nr:hypothetical protein [Candidatus Nitrososphaera gargensis]AFU57445.1 hypothetical protein Ngar_c05010 [Candidatus Nitrososphaera gargensis Ga9.2]
MTTEEQKKPSDAELRTIGGSSRFIETHPKVVPTDFGSVFAEKIMIGVDEVQGIVTMTFLQRNLHPQIGSNGWQISDVNWKVIAEVKTPMVEMNALMIYYIAVVTGGMDVLPVIQQYLKQHPKAPSEGKISYGPTRIETK